MEVNSTVYFASSIYDLFDRNNLYKLTITFNCIPSKSERMLNAVKDEIEALRQDGPTPEVLKNVKAKIALYMPSYKENAELMTMQLVDRYRYNKERVLRYNLMDYIQNITVTDVKELAQKYLKEKNYYQFIASEKNSHDEKQ